MSPSCVSRYGKSVVEASRECITQKIKPIPVVPFIAFLVRRMQEL